ncbi:hypothetical protein [Treponema sp. SP13]|uniref:hypothetical protein n=1 Tax=Treponema sp. SP13 TaxID=2789742 RepID=UPI003D8FDED0
MKEKRTVPECFEILKSYKKYDLETVYNKYEHNGKKSLKKYTKKEFKNLLKNCDKKEDDIYSDYELEQIEYICSKMTNYSESLLDLKISYLEKIYEKEDRRQEVIDQKAHGKIEQTSLVIGLIGLFGAGGVFEIFKNTYIFLKVISFVLMTLMFFFFCLSIIWSVRVLIPRPYQRPRQALMSYGIENDIKTQKIGYFGSLYDSITWNQICNSKKNKLMEYGQKFFVIGLGILLIYIIVLCISIMLFSDNGNSNIFYFIFEQIKENMSDGVFIKKS